MKSPGLTAIHALPRIALRTIRGSAADAGSATGYPYRLSYCTSPLYATDLRPGHAWLKHCFMRIENADGDVEHWAIGRSGLVREPYPYTPFTRCWPAPKNLSGQQRSALLGALAERQTLGYSWGDNNCCSALVTAHRQALGGEPPWTIGDAARALATSPEIYP